MRFLRYTKLSYYSNHKLPSNSLGVLSCNWYWFAKTSKMIKKSKYLFPLLVTGKGPTISKETTTKNSRATVDSPSSAIILRPVFLRSQASHYFINVETSLKISHQFFLLINPVVLLTPGCVVNGSSWYFGSTEGTSAARITIRGCSFGPCRYSTPSVQKFSYPLYFWHSSSISCAQRITSFERGSFLSIVFTLLDKASACRILVPGRCSTVKSYSDSFIAHRVSLELGSCKFSYHFNARWSVCTINFRPYK